MAILSFRKKREKNTSQYPHRSPNFAFYEINKTFWKFTKKMFPQIIQYKRQNNIIFILGQIVS